MSDDDNNWMQNYVRYSSIILQTIIMIVGSIFLGHWVDKWMNLKAPVFLIIFTLVFSSLSFYLTFKRLIEKNKKK